MIARSLIVWLIATGCGFSVAPATTGEDGGGGGSIGDSPPPIDAMCGGPDTDGDGIADVCDPCPADATNDTDGDTVCDGVDACPGQDDLVDTDGDQIADGCDDWPCGVRPEAPPSIVPWVTLLEGVTLSSVSIGNQGRLAVTTPGATLSVSASFSIHDCQCTNCIDQIELGFEPGGKQTCLYNGNPQGSSVAGCGILTLGTETRTVTAPAQPGVHQLRFNRGNDASCQNNGMWWVDAPPPSTSTIALVCVH